MDRQITPTQVIRNLSEKYEHIDKIVEFKKLDQGLANANYHLKTSERSLFMKIIPPQQYNRLQRYVGFYKNIVKSDIETVQPIINDEGEIISEVAGEKLLLFPFATITEPSINEVTAEMIGSLAARLHLTNIDVSSIEKAWYGKERCLEQLSSLDAADQEKYLAYLPIIKDMPTDLPQGFVFDDICTDNIYAIDNQLLGFIDPENSGYGEFIFDIAGAIIMCFMPSSDRFELIKQFLKGYQTYRPLESVEKENLFESLLLLCVQLSLFFEQQPEAKNIAKISQRLDMANMLTGLGKDNFTQAIGL